MSSFATALALLCACNGTFDEDAAVEIRYKGHLSRVERGGEREEVKQFEVYCVLTPAIARVRDVFYHVDERGTGWPWPERFGRIALDAEGKPAEPGSIRLLHDHDGTAAPIEFGVPLFADSSKLKEGASWRDEAGTFYEVSRQRQIGERSCWQVEVNPAQARRATLWIEVGSSLVVAAQKRVFMGRGDEFELRYELDGLRELPAPEFEKLHKPMRTLLELQAGLARSEETARPELTAAQLAKAANVVDGLAEEARGTPLEQLAAVIGRDVKSQSQREESVTRLAGKMIGQKAPAFVLQALERAPIDSKTLSGKIVVLHFWNYNDDPLVEPYGQVGYLDFLNGKRRKLGVEVMGVAVNSLTEDPQKRPAALRSIRKLQRFMNLSYPIGTDDGSVLRSFGDPRALDASLPLWVVIDADGNVAHYHVGFYDIRADEGLKPLDDVVVELLRKQRSAE